MTEQQAIAATGTLLKTLALMQVTIEWMAMHKTPYNATLAEETRANAAEVSGIIRQLEKLKSTEL